MVHLRSKKFKGKKGRERIYWYLVKDTYNEGKKMQKIIKYVGTSNKLLEKLQKLEQLEKKYNC